MAHDAVQGYLAHKKQPPPHRALGTVLLYGPRRLQFLVSKVPLYMYWGTLHTSYPHSENSWVHVLEFENALENRLGARS